MCVIKMKVITDKENLFDLFKELNSGGVYRYDEDDQALEFKLESIGGEMEAYTLVLTFPFVEYFHLPVSLDACSFNGYGIDEIREASEEEARQVMPVESCETMNYKKSDYRCFRFYANEYASPFYIYSLGLTGSLLDNS
jgi:hypothetical protein